MYRFTNPSSTGYRQILTVEQSLDYFKKVRHKRMTMFTCARWVCVAVTESSRCERTRELSCIHGRTDTAQLHHKLFQYIQGIRKSTDSAASRWPSALWGQTSCIHLLQYLLLYIETASPTRLEIVWKCYVL